MSIKRVLAIPLEEVHEHFALNSRQDVKIVAPEILAGKLLAKLQASGRKVKPEAPLNGLFWFNSPGDTTNMICEAREFCTNDELAVEGPFALCFANEKAQQDTHYHPHHVEIYFSEHPLEAQFRLGAGSRVEHVELKEGGVLVFAAGVVHRARLGGLTVVIEAPAVKDDKVMAEL